MGCCALLVTGSATLDIPLVLVLTFFGRGGMPGIVAKGRLAPFQGMQE